jgi:tRNA/tmRNA/rRNA uracil-C5-methylase (TrmA/RlmC/RlmD family)
MRNNALMAARREFYWEKESQRLVDLYCGVLSAPPPEAESGVQQALPTKG